MRLNLHAMVAALFLPMLLWTGSVVSISLMGYPSVICMTPLAWVLALPVGLRVRHQSDSPHPARLREAALAGAVLGLWQGLLFAVFAARLPSLPAGLNLPLSNPYLAGLVIAAISAPLTALLASGIVWLQQNTHKETP